MQETNFSSSPKGYKTTFVSSTPILYYGATNHYSIILTIICFISHKHSYKNQDQVVMFEVSLIKNSPPPPTILLSTVGEGDWFLSDRFED